MIKPSKIFKSKAFLTTKAFALVVFPAALVALPATYFDTGISICLFTLLSDISCWGCGLTRACMHLIHLNFQQAASFNHLSFIVLPILCSLYFQEFILTLKKIGIYRRVSL